MASQVIPSFVTCQEMRDLLKLHREMTDASLIFRSRHSSTNLRELSTTSRPPPRAPPLDDRMPKSDRELASDLNNHITRQVEILDRLARIAQHEREDALHNAR